MPDNEITEYLLTTEDNPYDPFTQFREWFIYDIAHGYNTCGVLAHFAHTSDHLSDADNIEVTNNAIEDILKLHEYQIYKRVKRKELAKSQT